LKGGLRPTSLADFICLWFFPDRPNIYSITIPEAYILQPFQIFSKEIIEKKIDPEATRTGLGKEHSCIDMNQSKRNKVTGDSIQAVIEVYKKDVDKSLIRQNLELTVEERLLNLEKFVQFAEKMRQAGKQLLSDGSAKK
jgi:hypothetical protein